MGLILDARNVHIDTFLDLNVATLLGRLCALGRTSQIRSAMGLRDETNEIESSTEVV